jgi:hypothetical protein
VGVVVSGIVGFGVEVGVGAGVVVGVGSGVVVGVVEGSVVVVVSTGDSNAPTGPDVIVVMIVVAMIAVAARIAVATTARSCRRRVMRSIRFGSWRRVVGGGGWTCNGCIGTECHEVHSFSRGSP